MFSLYWNHIKIIAMIFNRASPPHIEKINLACTYISGYEGYINILFVLALIFSFMHLLSY